MSRKIYFQQGSQSPYVLLGLPSPYMFGRGWRNFRVNKSKPK